VIRELGFRDLEVPELYGLDAAAFARGLKENKLEASCLAVRWEELAGETNSPVKTAHALGVNYLMCPWIPHGAEFTQEDCTKAVERLGSAAGKLARSGLTLCYHMHGFEFREAETGTLADRLIRETKGSGLQFELDTFWVTRAGHDPVRILRTYADRFPLVHLRDMKKGTPTGDSSGKAPLEASVPLGQGMIDIRGVLRAGFEGQVAHWYIEDEHPEAIRQLPESVRFLTTVEF
jgi:sugar phosphate isomerase/epimerase